MAHITSIEDYRRLAAERKAAKAQAEANAKVISEIISEVANTCNDPAMRADLVQMTPSERHLRKVKALTAMTAKRAEAIRRQYDFTTDETSGSIRLTK